MVYTIFLGKQGKRVCTMGPERRVYTTEPQTQKKKERRVSTVVVYTFLFPDRRPLRPSRIAEDLPENLPAKRLLDGPILRCKKGTRVRHSGQNRVRIRSGWEGSVAPPESFCESGKGVRLPKERGWPPGKSGDLRGSLGNFRGGLGNFRGTAGLLSEFPIAR